MLALRDIENNVLVTLNICGYQFPEDSNDDWCLIKAHIIQGEDEFERIDPALEAAELLELRDWFKNLSQRTLPRYSRLSFTEPCLSFEYLSFDDEIVRFSIEFSNELQPLFKLKQFHSSTQEWNVVFGLKPDELATIAATIEEVCRLYPAREEN